MKKTTKTSDRLPHPAKSTLTESEPEGSSAGSSSRERLWMKHTGKMKHLRNEIERTNKWIEEAFEKIEKDRER
jgi:hypothetical protein